MKKKAQSWAEKGWSKEDVKLFIFEHARLPYDMSLEERFSSSGTEYEKRVKWAI